MHCTGLQTQTEASCLHLVWDFQVLIQEHFELADADVQIAVGELVGNVEAQRAEFPSLQHDSVEEAQRQEQRLEVGHLRKRHSSLR